jgi:recombination protein RecR
VRLIPPSLQALTQELSKLPGVGERSALRYAVNLIRGGERRIQNLVESLQRTQSDIQHCPTCHFWTTQGHCPVCSDSNRPLTRICVVRDCPDVLALERGHPQSWKYHVLQGLLSPLSGVGPQQIRLSSLMDRCGEVQELILAFDATIEGDATALYIRDRLKELHPHVKLTRTAMGLPAGSSIEYLDSSTLENALIHRNRFE